MGHATDIGSPGSRNRHAAPKQKHNRAKAALIDVGGPKRTLVDCAANDRCPPSTAVLGPQGYRCEAVFEAFTRTSSSASVLLREAIRLRPMSKILSHAHQRPARMSKKLRENLGFHDIERGSVTDACAKLGYRRAAYYYKAGKNTGVRELIQGLRREPKENTISADTIGGTGSGSCSAASRTGAASQRATTVTQRPSSPPSLSAQPSYSGFDDQ